MDEDLKFIFIYWSILLLILIAYEFIIAKICNRKTLLHLFKTKDERNQKIRIDKK